MSTSMSPGDLRDLDVKGWAADQTGQPEDYVQALRSSGGWKSPGKQILMSPASSHDRSGKLKVICMTELVLLEVTLKHIAWSCQCVRRNHSSTAQFALRSI